MRCSMSTQQCLLWGGAARRKEQGHAQDLPEYLFSKQHFYFFSDLGRLKIVRLAFLAPILRYCRLLTLELTSHGVNSKYEPMHNYKMISMTCIELG